MTASYAASPAESEAGVFPPLPPDQTLQGEGFFPGPDNSFPPSDDNPLFRNFPQKDDSGNETETMAAEENEDDVTEVPEEEIGDQNGEGTVDEEFPPPEPPKRMENIMHYRGQRMYLDPAPLQIWQARCFHIDEKTLIIEILFNQTINPRTIGRESILVGGEVLPEGTRFSFNKKGDTIRIVYISENDDITLSVQNIFSFNGKAVEPVEMMLQVDE